jgi:hypothetical protein
MTECDYEDCENDAEVTLLSTVEDTEYDYCGSPDPLDDDDVAWAFREA